MALGMRRIPSHPVLIGIATAAVVGFALWPHRVDPIDACPDGARLAGAPPPSGRQQWCERETGGRPVKHGPYVAWHANGRRKIEGTYAEGEKEGRWVFSDPEGRRREEGVFRNGREQGVWTRWLGNGHRLEEGEYRNGVRHGRWTFWHENGRKAREGEYREGVESGRWERWNVRGEPCPRTLVVTLLSSW